MSDLKPIANFLFEAGNLSKTPRSFHPLLGSDSQTVAEHINRACYVGYVLATLDGTVDVSKVMKMCLFHDFAESRVSDLNYLHQKYTDRREMEAVEDVASEVPFGEELKELVKEYAEHETPEGQLAKDADNIEFLLSLKEQVDTGNTRAKTWIPAVLKRLKTKVAQDLAAAILETESDEWWF